MVPHAPNRVIPEHGVKILIAEHQEYQECDTPNKETKKCITKMYRETIIFLSIKNNVIYLKWAICKVKMYLKIIEFVGICCITY